jgi:chitodextrinase
VVDVLPTRVTLTWQPPNTNPLVTYYRIYRVTTRDGQPYEEFYNASYTTSLLLALLTPDTEYTFFVETGDQTSNGLRSPRLTFRTPAAPVESQPPTTPGTPTATPGGPNQLTLTWTPSTDNFGVAAYHIYRTRFDGVVESAGATVTATTTTFTRLLPDFDYRYHIVAVDHTGNRSAPSGFRDVRMPADPRSSCQVRYTATDQAGGTFAGQITLRNTGIFHEVFTVRMTFTAGQRLTLSWDLSAVQTGADVVFWYDGWAGGLSVGERIIRFTGTHAGTNPPPTGFRLNGQPCTPL